MGREDAILILLATDEIQIKRRFSRVQLQHGTS